MNGQIELKDRTVCYLDLMGFSAAVTDRTKVEDENLVELAEMLTEIKRRLDESYGDARLEFQSLSDSIFICTKDNSRSSLTALLSASQEIYLYFLLNGFLTRGGISSGKCYITPAIVLGEPVVRAVKLEQTVADTPRIVLSSKTVDLLRRTLDARFFSDNIWRGKDGPYWVFPFFPVISAVIEASRTYNRIKDKTSDRAREYSKRLEVHLAELNKVSDIVTNSLDRIQEDRRVFIMYDWLFSVYSEAIAPARKAVGERLSLPEYRN